MFHQAPLPFLVTYEILDLIEQTLVNNLHHLENTTPKFSTLKVTKCMIYEYALGCPPSQQQRPPGLHL